MTGYQSKRAAAQDKLAQEPVAWLEPEWGEKICPEVGYEVTMTDDHPRDLCWIPLYAHPPQGEPWRESASDYERGVIDGMQKQAQSSVDKAVNAMTQPTYYIPSKDQRPWVDLTDKEIDAEANSILTSDPVQWWRRLARAVLAKSKEKNNG